MRKKNKFLAVLKSTVFLLLLFMYGCSQKLDGTYYNRLVEGRNTFVFQGSSFTYTNLYDGDIRYGEGSYKLRGKKLILKFEPMIDVDTPKYNIEYSPYYSKVAHVNIIIKDADGLRTPPQNVEVRDKKDLLITAIESDGSGKAFIWLAKYPQIGYLTIGSPDYSKVKIPADRLFGKSCTIHLSIKRTRRSVIEPRKEIYKILEASEKKLKLFSEREESELFLRTEEPQVFETPR
ncbi:MAG: hypothetical protein V4594_17725 [Bacteroidota bacterium]